MGDPEPPQLGDCVAEQRVLGRVADPKRKVPHNARRAAVPKKDGQPKKKSERNQPAKS
jgi:hypothetical protein